jgi:hypothetical protein
MENWLAYQRLKCSHEHIHFSSHESDHPSFPEPEGAPPQKEATGNGSAGTAFEV